MFVSRTFLNNLLQIPTILSANLFDWGWCGDKVVCLKLEDLAKFANSVLEYCGLLSPYTTSGMPRSSKRSFICQIIAADVVGWGCHMKGLRL